MPIDFRHDDPGQTLDELESAIASAEQALVERAATRPSPVTLMQTLEIHRNRVYEPLARLDLWTRVCRTDAAVSAFEKALRAATSHGQFTRDNATLQTAVIHAAEQANLLGPDDAVLQAFFRSKASEYARSGVALSADGKARLSEIGKRLSVLAAAFRRNVELGESHENRPLITEMLTLRSEMARVLGYSTFSDLARASSGIPQSDVVESLIDDYRDRLTAQTQALASTADGGSTEDTAWRSSDRSDSQSEHAFEPAISIQQAITAISDIASGLLGVTLCELDTEIPLRWSDSALAYAFHVDGERHGTVYLDLFGREGKRQDMHHFPIQFRHGVGTRVRHAASLVSMSLPDPSLDQQITPLQCQALFHEFGHALHQLMSAVGVADLEGVRAPRDVLEIPSTIFEYIGKCFVHATRCGKDIRQLDANELRLALRDDHSEIQRKSEILRKARYDNLVHSIDWTALQGDAAKRLQECLDRSEVRPNGVSARWDCTFHHVYAGRYAGSYYSYLTGDAVALRLLYRFTDRVPDWRAFGAFLKEHVYAKGAMIDVQHLTDDDSRW